MGFISSFYEFLIDKKILNERSMIFFSYLKNKYIL